MTFGIPCNLLTPDVEQEIPETSVFPNHCGGTKPQFVYFSSLSAASAAVLHLVSLLIRQPVNTNEIAFTMNFHLRDKRAERRERERCYASNQSQRRGNERDGGKEGKGSAFSPFFPTFNAFDKTQE